MGLGRNSHGTSWASAKAGALVGEIISSMTGNSRERIVLPIFASNDAGPEIYRSIDDLEHDAEPIDVDNKKCVGYDATGKQIAFLEIKTRDCRAGQAAGRN